MKSVLVLCVLGTAVTAGACLNDRDTLGEEARTSPEATWIIVGRFERNPPEYYEMRVARIQRELALNPGDLKQYDDIAVAFDRLHRDDDALAWIQKKRRILKGLPDSKSRIEDWYRTDANAGTFFAHRWFSSAKPSHPDDLRHGRDLIAEALRLKPNAHFGRETYQLAVLDWALDVAHGKQAPLAKYVSKVLGANGRGQSPEEITRGLVGLIRLGGAWESPDVYEAISTVMEGPHRQRVGNLAALRRDELDLGKKQKVEASEYRMGPSPEEAVAFKNLRKGAEAWNAKRVDFMLARFKEGRHPDTDPAFWNGYRESAYPELPVRSSFDHFLDNPPMWSVLLVLGVAGLILIGVLVFVGFCITASLNAIERRFRKKRG